MKSTAKEQKSKSSIKSVNSVRWTE